MKFVDVNDIIRNLNNITSEKELSNFFKKYRKVQCIDITVVNYAEELIKGSNYEKGVMIIKGIYETKYLEYISDDITVYIILAQYYIENGDTEKGKKFLIKIANETTDNYEESLEFRGWLDTWNKYKHLVKDEIPAPIFSNDKELSDEDLLELLLKEVHSGGYDAYLSYNGQYFERTLKIAETKNMNSLVEQLQRIKSKFPNDTVPNNAIDIIENSKLSFNDEDELFYSTVCFEFDKIK